jgi:Tetracyclin repressor-like, C-terminal domain
MRGLRALEGTPLAEADKAATMLMLHGFVQWEARLTAELGHHEPGTPNPAEVYAGLARSLVHDGRFPAFGRAVATGIFEDDSRETGFSFGLSVVLDGVERLIAQASK